MKKNCLALIMSLSLMTVMAVGAISLAPANAEAAPKNAGKVVVYNWSEYIPQPVLDNFTKETGIEVVYSTFESNEAMIAKVKLMKGKGYDVVVPSSYFIEIMNKDDLLAEIDHKKLPNLANLDPKWFGHDYDPENKYSIPYMWGFVGLAYNKKYVKPEQMTKWADLLRPEFKGKIIMTDDLRDAYTLALKAVGRKATEISEEGIKDAYEFMVKMKPSVRIFDVTATKQSLISEEVWVGPIWNGDFLVAKEENEDLEFVFPEEGAVLWMDTFVIPKGAENMDNAHAFINYMLRPDVAAECVAEFRYSTPNAKVLELLPEEDKNNPVLIPTDENYNKAEFPAEVGDAISIYQKYWEMLKTNQ